MMFPNPRKQILLLLLSLSVMLCWTLTLSTGSAQASKHGKVAVPRDYAAWSRVAVCESGGWHVLGPAYPDSLGITRHNYTAFGGNPQSYGTPSMAARAAQIKVADRFIRAYGIGIPDQHGCAGAW